MRTVLALTSHVAASSVGAAALLCLAPVRRARVIFAPTVLYGRHPGHGAPGGAAVSEARLAGLLEGVEAAGAFKELSAVMTGYLANAGQTGLAVHAIETARAQNPEVFILVDPIIGDESSGVYADEGAAFAIRDALVPRADLITPNAFELAWLTGRDVTSVEDALAASEAVSAAAVLCSSVPAGDQMGVVYQDGNEAWAVRHERFAAAPHGTGDLLAAAFLLSRLSGASVKDALESAVGAVLAAIKASASGELDLHAALRAESGPEAQTLD